MTKLLKLPGFLLGLVFGNLINLLQLVFFKAGSSRLAAANLLLTIAVIGILVAWRIIPYPQPVTPPEIGLATDHSQEIAPRYFTWNEEEIQMAYTDYQTRVEQQTFNSQADYVNLAVLAHAAGEYDRANQYLELAKYLDPNRDFFLK